MPKVLKLTELVNEVRHLKHYILLVVPFLVLSYAGYLVFDDNTIIVLAKEDGPFEYLTALFFLGASIFFLVAFCSKRNIFFLLLAIVLFVGMGEEISWGQRILKFHVPGSMERLNVQHEFNIHNLKTFYGKDASGNPSGRNILAIDFLYKMFWLTYGVLLPVGAFYVQRVYSLTKRLRLPLPPVSIGVFFLVSWLVFRITLSYLLPPDKIPAYYNSITEIYECISAFIFMILSFYFYSTRALKSISPSFEMVHGSLEQ